MRRKSEGLLHAPRLVMDLFFCFFFNFVLFGGKAGLWRERTGPTPGYVPSCYIFFFSSTQIQKQKVSKLALLRVIGGSTDLFLLLFLLRLGCFCVYSPQGDVKCPSSLREVMDWRVWGFRRDSVKSPVCRWLVHQSGSGSLLATRTANSLMVPCCSKGSRSDRGLAGPTGGTLFDSWLISGLIDRKLWIGWIGRLVARS